MGDLWNPPDDAVCGCCFGNDIDSLGQCADCYHGDCGATDCEQAASERNWERWLESYYGGDQPVTDRERYVKAWRDKQ